MNWSLSLSRLQVCRGFRCRCSAMSAKHGNLGFDSPLRLDAAQDDLGQHPVGLPRAKPCCRVRRQGNPGEGPVGPPGAGSKLMLSTVDKASERWRSGLTHIQTLPGSTPGLATWKKNLGAAGLRS